VSANGGGGGGSSQSLTQATSDTVAETGTITDDTGSRTASDGFTNVGSITVSFLNGVLASNVIAATGSATGTPSSGSAPANGRTYAPVSGADPNLVSGGIKVLPGGGMSQNNGVVYLIDSDDPGTVPGSSNGQDMLATAGGKGFIELDSMKQSLTSLQAYAAKNGKIKALYIDDHGSEFGQRLGVTVPGRFQQDLLSNSTNSLNYLQDVGKLMGEGGIIVLGGCEVGHTPGMIQDMADAVAKTCPKFRGIYASRTTTTSKPGKWTGDFYLTTPSQPAGP